MKTAQIDEYLPTLMFGFQLVKGKDVLHQMWVTPTGLTEWREIPVIREGLQRPAAIAGYLEDDDEND